MLLKYLVLNNIEYLISLAKSKLLSLYIILNLLFLLKDNIIASISNIVDIISNVIYYILPSIDNTNDHKITI